MPSNSWIRGRRETVWPPRAVPYGRPRRGREASTSHGFQRCGKRRRISSQSDRERIGTELALTAQRPREPVHRRTEKQGNFHRSLSQIDEMIPSPRVR